MRLLLVIGVVVVLASSACSDETGILLKSRTAAEIDSPVDRLRFFVGVDVTDFSDPEYFLDDQVIPDVTLTARDLSDEPHRLMIRPNDVADSKQLYAIGVIAFNGGQPVGFGYLTEPVGFVQGSVTQWNIEIHPLRGADDGGSTADCLRWRDPETGVEMNIGSALDRDCDGLSPDGGDCNDSDPNVYMGADEICGNLVDDNCDDEVDGMIDGMPVAEIADGLDNDCDGICDNNNRDDVHLDVDGDGFTTFGRYGVCSDEVDAYDCDDTTKRVGPGVWDFCNGEDDNCDDTVDGLVPCFAYVPDPNAVGSICLQGERQCAGAGAAGACMPLSVPNETLSFGDACVAEEQCIGNTTVGRARCLFNFLDERPTADVYCKTHHSPQTGTCQVGDEQVALPPLEADGGSSCTYQIVGPENQQGYVVALEGTNSGGQGTVVNECVVHLDIQTTPASGFAEIFIVGQVEGGETKYYKVTLLNEPIDACDDPEAALACTGAQVVTN